MAWTQHNPLPLCLLSPLWPPGRTKPCRVLNAFSDCIWTWVLSWLTRKQLWAHGVVSVCCHHAQGGIAPRGPRSPGQRGTKTPAHLVQLQLSQDVRRHSIPDSHNLWKARERGVRLQASQLTASRQAPRPGGDRCRCPQPAQTNTARAAELGSAPISHCQPYSAPGAGLGQKWRCGKGSAPGLWPSNPQKVMAPQHPGHDLPAW